MDDKKVRIGFEVNAKGLNDAREAIRALTRDITKLSEVASRVNLGGLMGGVSSKKGPINARQEAIRLPGLSSNFGNAITKDAQALGQTARAGTQAIDILTRSLKSNFSGQIQDIDRLEAKLGRLEKAYGKLKDTAENVHPQSRTARDARSEMRDNRRERFGIETELADRRDLAGKTARWSQGRRLYTVPEAEGGGPGTGAGGTGAGGGRGFFSGVVGTAAGATGLGVGAAALTSPAALGAAAVGLAIKAINATAARTTANAANDVSIGMEPTRLGARIGGSLGGMGMSIRGGDLALSMAYDKMRVQMGTRNGLGGQRERLRQEEAGLTGTGALTTPLGAMLGEGWDGPDSSDPKKRAYNLQLEKSRRAERAEISEEQAEMARNWVAANPKESQFRNSVFSEAGNRNSIAKSGGIGFGLVYDKKSGKAIGTSQGRFEAAALRSGFEASELAGGRGQLGSIAGRGLMGGAGSMLSAQYGGFHNAADIIGLGAQYGLPGRNGKVNPMGLFNTAQYHGMGKGGVDATAGSHISGIVASLMGSGNFLGSDGNALMMGMMSAGRSGSTGGDMLRASQMQGGVNTYGNLLAGKTDNLQQGINMLAAQGSGAEGWYAKKALMGMGVGEMTSALRTGKVSASLADQGVDIGMVRRYKESQDSYAFSRYMDGEGAGTAAGRSVAGVKAAGGVNAYLKTIKGTKNREDEIRRLGGALAAVNGGTLNEQIGSIYAGMAGDKELAPDVKSKGAWKPGMKGTATGDVYEHRAKAVEEQDAYVAKENTSIRQGLQAMDTNQKELSDITKSLVGDVTALEGVVKGVTAGFMEMLATLFPKYAADLANQQDAYQKTLKQKAVAKAHEAGKTIANTINEGLRARGMSPNGTVDPKYNDKIKH